MEYTTALYFRLSSDDGAADDSCSIKNQRDLLRRFVSAHPALSSGKVLEFADDGWSGMNFDRPNVKELLNLTRRGEVQCIVVKDLSRWGRNYIDVNEHIEQIFPFLGVRFISVNDHYDSDDYKGRTAPMDIAFTSIIHDSYCKDLSMKIRQSYVAKAKKGEFVQGVAPYGYMKSASAKKVEIDVEASEVVRRIFSHACEGLKPSKIVALLNADKVDSPIMYQRRLGRKAVGYQSMVSEGGVWTETTIRRIIADERYTGVSVFGKTRQKSIGGKKSARLPEGEWIKVPGTHDAIVSEDVYKKANASIRHHKKSGVNTNKVPFAGKLKCGYCGHALRFYSSKNPYFLCQGPSLNYGMGCSNDRLYLDDLQVAVLAAVKLEARKVFDEQQKHRQAARCESESKTAALSELKRIMAQVGLLERRGDELYEDFAVGKLHEDLFLSEKSKYAGAIAKLEVRAAELNERMDVSNRDAAPSDEPLLRRVIDAVDVTDDILSLIDRVIVYDPARIEIRFASGDTNMNRV